MTIRMLTKIFVAIVLLSNSAGAAAVTINYAGTMTMCTFTCDSFASLGGPGGSSNGVSSVVTGAVTIDATPGGTFADADILEFSFEIFNPAVGQVNPVFDASGNLLNPTTTNPLPLDAMVAIASGSGVLSADGGFASGELVFTFTAAPFSNNDAAVSFDLATGQGVGTLFGGIIQFVGIDGTFSPVPLPGAVWLLATALLAGGGMLRRR